MLLPARFLLLWLRAQAAAVYAYVCQALLAPHRQACFRAGLGCTCRSRRSSTNSAFKLLCVTCSRTVDSAWFCPWLPGACATTSVSERWPSYSEAKLASLACRSSCTATFQGNGGRQRRAGRCA